MTEQPRRPPGMGFIGAAILITRMAIAIGVCVLLGDLLDRLLHTSPWFMVVGVVAGVVIVIVDLERKASRHRRAAKKKASQRERADSGATQDSE